MGLLDSNLFMALGKSITLTDVSISNTGYAAGSYDVKSFNCAVLKVSSISSGGKLRVWGGVGNYEALDIYKIIHNNAAKNSLEYVSDIDSAGDYAIDISRCEGMRIYVQTAVQGGTFSGGMYFSQTKQLFEEISSLDKIIKDAADLIRYEDGGLVTASIDLSTTGNKLEVTHIEKYRSKYMKLDMTITGITRYSGLKVFFNNLQGNVIFSDGSIYSQIYDAPIMESFRHHEFHKVVYVPLADINANSFVLRNNEALNGASMSVSYGICDLPKEIPSLKPIQYIGNLEITPSGVGTFGKNFLPSYLTNIPLKSFKYYFVAVYPITDEYVINTQTNYDVQMYDGSLGMEPSSPNNALFYPVSYDVFGATHACRTDWKKVFGEVLRVLINVNTYVAGVKYRCEIFGVR